MNTVKVSGEKEHKERHIELHKMLDELVADFISQTNNLPSKTTVMEFMKWSYEQTVTPTEKVESVHLTLCGRWLFLDGSLPQSAGNASRSAYGRERAT